MDRETSIRGMEPDLHLSTRRSLITRLKHWDDQEGWREFFQTYWKLIYGVAMKSGLTATEAEDVVQETVVTVAKTMDRYRYDPEKCRFKTWLMRIARLRIADQFRKRDPAAPAGYVSGTDSSAGLESWERVADPAAKPVEEIWEEEWRKNLVSAAMDRVKEEVRPEHYQIFFLNVVKEVEATQVARALGVSVAQVYVIKHRVSARVRREVERLEAKMNER